MLNKVISTNDVNSVTAQLKHYHDRLREFCSVGECKRYGRYLVKESFEGELSLTELLSEYIE